MALKTYEEVMDDIGQVLVNANIIENKSQMSQAGLLNFNKYFKTGYASFSLYLVRNKINGNRTIFLRAFAPYEGAFTDDNVSYGIDIINKPDSFSGYYPHVRIPISVQNIPVYEYEYPSYTWRYVKGCEWRKNCMLGVWHSHSEFPDTQDTYDQNKGYVGANEVYTGEVNLWPTDTDSRLDRSQITIDTNPVVEANGSSITNAGFGGLYSAPFYVTTPYTMYFNGMDDSNGYLGGSYEVTTLIDNYQIYYEETPVEPDPPTPPTPDPPTGSYDQIELWRNFNKRDKSTKTPSVAGEVFNIHLLDNTDVESPSFTIQRVYFDYNYCKWGGNYYRCTVTNISKTLSRIDCVFDDLANAKSFIKASNAYIERCSWATNHIIIDGLNPATDEVVIKNVKAGTAVCSSDDGMYWITTTSVSGLGLYQLTPAQFKTFCDALWDTSQTTPENIKRVMENIISVKRVPFTASGDAHNFDIGNFYLKGGNGDGQNVPTAMSVTKINFTESQNGNSGAITIPFASSDYGYNAETYLDHSPYCTALIYLPFVGCVPLDLDAFSSLRTLYVYWSIDRMATGITYTIRTGAAPDGQVISTYTGNFGTSIPISANTYDQRGLISSQLAMFGGAAAMVGGIASGNPLMAAGGLGALASGSMQSQKAAELHTQLNGGLSSNLGFYVWDGYVHVITINKKPVSTDLDTNKTLCGIPVKAVGSLNHNGYVQTVNAQISMPFHIGVRERVNALLDSGIYIE